MQQKLQMAKQPIWFDFPKQKESNFSNTLEDLVNVHIQVYSSLTEFLKTHLALSGNTSACYNTYSEKHWAKIQVIHLTLMICDEYTIVKEHKYS